MKGADMPLENLLGKLSAFEPTGLPVISLYLNAEADEHGRHNFDVFVRKELKERARTYEPESPERNSFDEDMVRINRYLEQEIKSPTKGIVMFTCGGAHDFFQAAQIEVPIEQSRVFVYDRPHVYPLARLLDQYRRYAVLLADTNTARIFVFALGQTLDQQNVKNVKTNRSQVGGWSQTRYQRHVENYHQQHAKEVVERLERVVRDENIDHVILAGNEETIIPLLREEMSKELSEKVIDTISLNINTPEHELLDATIATYRKYDAVSDLERVQQLLDEYRGGGLGVVGVPETLAALSNGQVEELFISGTVNNLSFEEAEVEKVMSAYATSEGKQVTLEPRTVADELVMRAQHHSSAKVTFIEDASLLESVGGVGALLRYRI
jgi:peptide chain release factor subunit 1